MIRPNVIQQTKLISLSEFIYDVSFHTVAKHSLAVRMS